ncbi:MAG: hypothetical protein Q7U91_10820 [Sideroxyarcus sp.]|nr:hypothetical protein [Sideroxyarcus sp.]
MDVAKSYQVSTFPKDDNLWRVDWMAGIRKNTHAPSEHLITVFLTRLNTSIDPESIDPLSNQSLSKSHHLADIGVGILPVVWIGSVWRNGYFVEENIEYSTGNFEVDTTSAKFCEFSALTDKGDKKCRIIPAYEYPVGIEAWKRISRAPFIALPYRGDPNGLLIPAIEVIRFYYIYSSYSARSLFFGEYDKLLREPTSFDPVTKIVKIFFHWFCRKSDAWILARYKASPLMQMRATQIHEWAQIASVNESSFTPSHTAFFPFDGRTRLTAAIKPIIGEDGEKRFLAVRLKRCTASMPFTDVHLEIATKPTNPKEAEERKPIWGRIWPHGLDVAKEFDHSGEPDKRYFPISIEILEDRFAALDGKKLIVVKKTSDKPKGKAVVLPPDEPKKGVGTSDGTYGENDTAKGNVRTDVTSQEDNSLKADIDSFIVALKYLRNKEKMTVTTIPVAAGSDTYRDETVSHFQQTRDEYRWTSIGKMYDDKDKLRIVPRRLIVAEVSLNNLIGYAMEIERKPGKNETISVLILAKNDYSRMTPEEFNSFIDLCVARNRWPTKGDTETRNYRRAQVAHQTRPGEELGARMAAAFFAIGLTP